MGNAASLAPVSANPSSEILNRFRRPGPDQPRCMRPPGWLLIAPDDHIRPPRPVPDTNQPTLASERFGRETSREAELNPVKKVGPGSEAA